MNQNLFAERGVIAALIRDPDGAAIVRLGIKPDQFSHEPAKSAFLAIVALIADGVRPDAATLRSALTDASLIEVETSLQEHVSSANLPAYVRLLKDCHQQRILDAARKRLAKAATAGASEQELSAILASIRDAQPREPGSDDESGPEIDQEFCKMADFVESPPDNS